MSNRNLTIKFSNQNKCDCPGSYCIDNNVKNSFRRFAIFDKDSNTELELLDSSFGVCDKKDKCGYRKTAKGLFYPVLDMYIQTGKVYPIYPSAEEYKASKVKSKPRVKKVFLSRRNRSIIKTIRVAKPVQSINKERIYIPNKSYNRFEFKPSNPIPYFFDGLPVSEDIIKTTCSKYRIGTIKDNYVSKSNLLLPYIDINGNIHGVEIKEFDKDKSTLKKPDGSKVNKQFHYYKLTSDSIRAVVSDGDNFLKQYQEQKPQRLTCFGTHLISEDTTEVIIHESCKNAIVFDLFSNQKRVVNIATGSLNNLTFNRFKWITDYQNIDITLIPDSEAIEDWTSKIDKNFSNQTMSSFDIISPVDLMEPYFVELDCNYHNYLSKYFVEGQLKIDIADLILDYWSLQSKGVKKRTLIEPQVSPIQQSESKPSNPTKVKTKPLQSIKPIFNLFYMYNQLTGDRDKVKRATYMPDQSIIEQMGAGWTIERKEPVQ